MKKYSREILLMALSVLVLTILARQGLFDFLSGFIGHLPVLLLTIIIGGALFLFAIRKEISILSHQHKTTNESIRKPLALFMVHRLRALQNVRTSLTSSEGFDLNLDELNKFVDACFSANRGKSYVGTDSNVPSRFYQLYPNYLGEQFSNSQNRKPGHDVRILLTSEDALRADYEQDGVSFADFCRSHIFNDVRLLQVEKSSAEKLAKNHGLPSPDLGVFGGKFVVFFSPHEVNGATVNYKIHIEPLRSERRAQLQLYLHMLNETANLIRFESGTVSCTERSPEDKLGDERRLLWDLTSSPWMRRRLGP